MSLIFLIFSLLILPASATAQLPGPAFSRISLAGTDDYRLGDEWGKKAVKAEDLIGARPAFRRAALATAKAGGATSFYLGRFQGQHVMATNHHVFEGPRQCLGRSIRFPLLGVNVTCEKFLGSWNEIDLALFVVRPANAGDEARLMEVGANFRFQEDVKPGQPLLTVGFGVAGNGRGEVMANEDSDCYVFSGEGEYRLMADPDRWNPGSYRAWSFALGCDVSHGDSGSAIVDRESGQVVGIIWTGRIPKSDDARSSRFLGEIFQKQNPLVWEELSYAVPARKIGEYLQRLLEGNSLPEDSQVILRALLQ